MGSEKFWNTGIIYNKQIIYNYNEQILPKKESKLSVWHKTANLHESEYTKFDGNVHLFCFGPKIAFSGKCERIKKYLF